MSRAAVRAFRPIVSLAILAFLSACAAGHSASVTVPLAADADVPYKKVLVVALFDSFDARRYLETEIVRKMSETGAVGVASTSMMNTKTPVVPQTFIDMVEKIGADAVVLTQLTSHDANYSEKDARPRSTYNYWPTYYYNVFEVQLTEYIEPPRLQAEHSLVLATQVFSVKTRQPVWAMESSSVLVEKQEDGVEYEIFVNEAVSIVNNMKRGKLITR